MYIILQNIFITETSNYTKRILHSHTDHYTNTGQITGKINYWGAKQIYSLSQVNRWKTRAICWYTKTHRSIVLGSITFPRNNFQLNLTCFHMVAKKDLATILDACWRSVVFITPPAIWPKKKHLYLLNRGQGRPNS